MSEIRATWDKLTELDSHNWSALRKSEFVGVLIAAFYFFIEARGGINAL